MMKPIRILQLPSYHPAVSKLHDQRMRIVNQNQDSFSELNKMDVAEFIKRYPLTDYDIVHIHFEYYLISLSKLKALLQVFQKHNKPIVWTWHDKKSLLREDSDFRYEKLLFKSVDRIITPTDGMRDWITATFGNHFSQIEKIPLGYMASPSLVKTVQKHHKKDRNLFTMLVGDFRDSKEYIQSIINFLQSTQLQSATLQVIFRPINIYSSEDNRMQWNKIVFHQIIQHSRVLVLCKTAFSDEEIAEAFYKSHAVILPYKWGDHSGQIELAKDCGCHVVVSDVGYYKEQWDKIWQYRVLNTPHDKISEDYVQQLVGAYSSPLLSPLGVVRQKEHKELLDRYYTLYMDMIKNKQGRKYR